MVAISWRLRFGVALCLVSAALFVIHYTIFHDQVILTRDLFFLLSLTPITVVFTTLILDELLQRRERQERLEKMNMVIGIFYSEIGVRLLRTIAREDPALDEIRKDLIVNSQWSVDDYDKVRERLKAHHFTVCPPVSDMAAIKQMLSSHRELLVQLLENPILLEHESFTDVLRSVFHLTEELDYRQSLEGLPEHDYQHLCNDVSRAYGELAGQWLSYTGYLQANYPYLFSLSMRTNPFDLNASPVVRE
ncbi:MAG: hypothetical protein WBZ29_09945 [Methanocella sp.]